MRRVTDEAREQYRRQNESKPTRGRRIIQLLHDANANDDGYVALKRATEDREDGHPSLSSAVRLSYAT